MAGDSHVDGMVWARMGVESESLERLRWLVGHGLLSRYYCITGCGIVRRQVNGPGMYHITPITTEPPGALAFPR